MGRTHMGAGTWSASMTDPITRLNAALEGRYRIGSELVKLAEELELEG